MKKIKKNKIIFITIMFVICSPALIYLVSFLSEFIWQNYGFVKLGSIDSWIQFAGSILGGSITMLALYLTIKEDKKNRYKESILKLMPIIVAEIDMDKNSKENNSLIKKIDDTDAEQTESGCFFPIKWKLSNVSNNYCNAIKVVYSEVCFDGYENNEVVFEELGITAYLIEISEYFSLVGNTSQVCQINVFIDKFNGHYAFSNISFSVKTKFEFYDILKENKYSVTVLLDIIVNITNNNKVVMFVEGIQTIYDKFIYE